MDDHDLVKPCETNGDGYPQFTDPVAFGKRLQFANWKITKWNT